MTVLKKRMENGTPFLLPMALKRINFLADSLEITQEEAAELTAIAEANGLEVLPQDALGRLARLEEENRELKKMIAMQSGAAENQEVTANA